MISSAEQWEPLCDRYLVAMLRTIVALELTTKDRIPWIRYKEFLHYIPKGKSHD